MAKSLLKSVSFTVIEHAANVNFKDKILSLCENYSYSIQISGGYCEPAKKSTLKYKICISVVIRWSYLTGPTLCLTKI